MLSATLGLLDCTWILYLFKTNFGNVNGFDYGVLVPYTRQIGFLGKIFSFKYACQVQELHANLLHDACPGKLLQLTQLCVISVMVCKERCELNLAWPTSHTYACALFVSQRL